MKRTPLNRGTSRLGRRSGSVALDRLWSQVVAVECGGLCVMGCGRLATESHHVLQRSLHPEISVKYEPSYGVRICSLCHIDLDDDSDAVEKVLNRLLHVDPSRYEAILLRINSEGSASRDAAEQRAYLRNRLKAAAGRWVDQEVDLAPGRRV
jgi:hypothetical protein